MNRQHHQYDPTSDHYDNPKYGCATSIGLAMVILAFFLFALTGCKTQCVPERIEVEKVVEYHHRDTTIVTEADSASLVALLECDSNYNVVMSDLAIANGQRLAMEAKLGRVIGQQVTLSVDCHEDSLQHRIEWLEKQLSEKYTETIVKTEKYTPPFARFCIYWTIGSWLLIVLAIMWKAVKLYMGGRL